MELKIFLLAMGRTRMPVKTTYTLTINRDMELALGLINKFLRLNERDRNFKVKVAMDFASEDYGYVMTSEELDWSKLTIYLNPLNCDRSEKTKSLGHPNDYSLLNIIIHEFCHYVDDKYLITMRKEQEFGEGKFKLTSYCAVSSSEETAETLACFMINPFLLKTIYPELYKFYSTIVKSPSPCTFKKFAKYLKEWPPVMRHCKGVKKILEEHSEEALKMGLVEVK